MGKPAPAANDSESDSDAEVAARAKADAARRQVALAAQQSSDSESEDARRPRTPKVQVMRAPPTAPMDADSNSEPARPDPMHKVQKAAAKPATVAQDSDSDDESTCPAPESQPVQACIATSIAKALHVEQNHAAAAVNSDSEAESAVAKPALQVAAKTKVAAPQDSDSDVDSDCDVEPAKPAAKAQAKQTSQSAEADSDSDSEVAKPAPKFEVALKKDMPQKPVRDSDSSDDTDSGEAKPGTVQNPGAKSLGARPVTGATRPPCDSESDSDSEPAKPAPEVKVAPKKAMTQELPPGSDSDSDSEPAKPCPKAEAAPKKANGQKSAHDSKSEAEVSKAQAAEKNPPAAVDSDSDSEPAQPARKVEVAPKKALPDKSAHEAEIQVKASQAQAVKKQAPAESDSDSDSQPTKPAAKVEGAPKKAVSTKCSLEPGSKVDVPKTQTPKKQMRVEVDSDSDSEPKKPVAKARKQATSTGDSTREQAKPAPHSQQTACVPHVSSKRGTPDNSGRALARALARMPAQEPARVLPMESDSEEDAESTKKHKANAKKQTLPKEKSKAVDNDDDGTATAVKQPTTAVQAAARQKVATVTSEKAKGADKKDGQAKDCQDFAASEKSQEADKKGGQDDVDPLRVYITGLPKDMSADRLRQDFSDCGKIKDIRVPLNEKGNSKSFGYIRFKTTSSVDAALARSGTRPYSDKNTLRVVVAKKFQLPNAGPKVIETQDVKVAAGPKTQPVPVEAAPNLESCQVLDMDILSQLLQAQASQDFSVLEAVATKISERARDAQAQAKLHLTVVIRNLPFESFDLEILRKAFAARGVVDEKIVVNVPMRNSGKTEGKANIMFKNRDSVEKVLGLHGTEMFGRKLIVVDATTDASSTGASQSGRKGSQEVTSTSKKRELDSSADHGKGLQTPEKTSKRKGAIEVAPQKKAKKDAK